MDLGVEASAREVFRLALLSELSRQGCWSVSWPACWGHFAHSQLRMGKQGRHCLQALGKGTFFFPDCSSAFEADNLGYCPPVGPQRMETFGTSSPMPSCLLPQAQAALTVHPSPSHNPGNSSAGWNFDWQEKAQPIPVPTRSLRSSWLHRPRWGHLTSVSTCLGRLPWQGPWGGEPWREEAVLWLV